VSREITAMASGWMMRSAASRRASSAAANAVVSSGGYDLDYIWRQVEREIQDHHPERTRLTAERAAAVLSVLTDG
jgi:hypothetical protein